MVSKYKLSLYKHLKETLHREKLNIQTLEQILYNHAANKSHKKILIILIFSPLFSKDIYETVIVLKINSTLY